MAISIPWLHSVSGSFNTAVDWSGGLVPVILDDAELSATGTYTVTSSESNNVFGLELNANTKLAITEGTFIDADGTDGLDDAGTIAIDNNTIFLVGFGASESVAIPLDVSGAMTLNSTGSPTTLILDGAGTTTDTIDLSGGGKLTLSGNANNLITGNSPGTILETSDTISGSGTISDLILQNSGLVNANSLKALVIIGPSSDTNTGTLEATSAGGLVLDNVTIENLLGTIAAAATGAVVTLESATINDGIVSTVAGSSMVTASGSGNELSIGDLNNAGTIHINTNSFLNLATTPEVNNSGAIELSATGAQRAELFLGGSVIFEGKGKVTLSDNSGNLIDGNGTEATLDNQNNTFSGAGTIGDSFTTLDNSGVIDGTGKNPLIIAASGADVDNFGTIESSSSGGLEFLNVKVNNESGTVATTTSGSHVDLSSSTIEFGSLKIVAGSTLNTVAGTTDQVTPTSALTNAGTVAVNNGSTLVIGSNVNNTGTIVFNNNNATPNLDIEGDISFADTGKVELAGVIQSNGSTAILTNVANTISGEGVIGDSFLTFNNDAEGVVDATDGFLNELVIDTQTNTVLNDGTMEDTGIGGLTIDSPLDNEGTIKSAGAGGVVIDNATITNNGKLIADDGILNISGAPSGTGSLTIGDSGEIEFGSSATGIGQNVTFSSGATGTLAFDAAATATPTAIYDGTISGFGPNDSIDLAGLSFTFASTTVSPPVFSAGNTTVTVTNGTDMVALTFAGNLTGDTFVVGDDGSGGTRLTDPVSKTTGSPITTLASTGSSLPLINHAGASNIALLGSYMASTFPALEGQVAAPLLTESAQSQTVLAHPHTG